ncbi:RING finger protein nhl-1-like [Pollicipes pollicipes]|uniref:RING finger protein nhl-1-like n=1 Tax=Pollicipes pollicipes TaxID=41117 RepID=UPI00188545ED|nr:RING finger protein nhl-1-like [Pollicipes pollicipes]
MDSFDSLLTCCICLDRFRNPKLLPCQHTFCMEPCMEGLIDYVKRQVKCPECRAEHRIPYKGIQEFPSNVTMQRFLEMYQAISGELPDPNQGQVMERCAICNEKEYLQPCAHCDKKICPDCKSAHVDVLKREVVRINSQVRRGLHRLQDMHQAVDKNASTVQQNCLAVREEVESLGKRLIKAIRDRTECLKAEVDSHMASEVRSLATLKAHLELEIANIESNSDLAEKHLHDNTAWDDCELMDAKDIFLKTVEFIRNFEHDVPGGSDYRRPIRFSAAQDPNLLSKTLEHFGELNITKKELQDAVGNGNASNGFALMHSSSSAGPGLMRSKSDHRLVAQLRQQEERGLADDTGRGSPASRRRFGDRAGRRDSEAGLHGDDSAGGDSPCERRHKYRSRFTRRTLDLDDDLESYRPEPSPAARDEPREKRRPREKVLDTEDASRGPLSGIARIADVPRVIQKLAEAERGPRVPEEKSEDDEISKIKKQNKEADRRPSRSNSSESTSSESSASAAIPKTGAAFSTTELKSRFMRGRAGTPKAEVSKESTSSEDSSESESESSDSDSDSEDALARDSFRGRASNNMAKTSIGPLLARSAQARSSASDAPPGAAGASRPSRSSTLASGVRRESSDYSAPAAASSDRYSSRYGATDTAEPRPYESRYSRYGDYKPSNGLTRSRTSSHLESRSSAVEPDSYSSYSSKYSRPSRPSYDDYTPRYSSYSSRFLNTSESSAAPDAPAESAQRSGDGGAAAGDMPQPAADAASKSEALSNWAQYLKSKYGYSGKDGKEKSKGVSRSRSSHLLRLLPDDSRPEEADREQVALPSPTAASVSLGCPVRSHYLQKGRLKFKIGSRGGGPGLFTWPRGIAVGPDNSIVVADSSNHRVQVFDQAGTFVKEFGQYGNGEAEFDCLAGVSVNMIGQFIISDRYNHRIQIFDPSGRFLRSFGQNGVMEGRFNYPWGVSTDALGFIYVCDKENHRVQVFQSDGTFVGTIGSEGRSSGQLAHPHYIAVSATNRVVVSDSNNHRVQVFDVNGKCLTTFGGEGGEEGKFKFPRGVAVDDQGYIVVGDSGNHRIQIFNPDGEFLKAFGCWGNQDGEFKGLEGVAVTSNGSVLVCDRENHRVQVF